MYIRSGLKKVAGGVNTVDGTRRIPPLNEIANESKKGTQNLRPELAYHFIKTLNK
jgi:hypothetical protein